MAPITQVDLTIVIAVVIRLELIGIFISKIMVVFNLNINLWLFLVTTIKRITFVHMITGAITSAISQIAVFNEIFKEIITMVSFVFLSLVFNWFGAPKLVKFKRIIS